MNEKDKDLKLECIPVVINKSILSMAKKEEIESK
jgi:hypothetical protein